MKIVKFTVEKNQDGYWAHREESNGLIAGYGQTITELKADVVQAYNLFFEDTKKTITEDQITFLFDLSSFFELHKEISPTGFAKRIKMQNSQLSEYINGKRTVTPKQAAKILTGLKELGKELTEMAEFA
ncbi:helix-turn-helix domain-containing protein [Mucilaginibacter myungsuensis]|uniref:Helix-turn-helix transcriptional regulator n=1 Tax=Mucilaginibacter myungsuensis TaxID=649104 RepID=A0A929PYA2_9SPHI|nr:helix-turn-helix transcriptional regulator [Mucilaginibacter myungsuensis]MBE9664026.1 helix-turn-helix transcriptional regulator [Mucilaginibacter myungsuensis]MDN3601205.1 helix-turn-helix transcriptional regulator [Mucilaginibacter myungsuensis]